MQEVSRLSTSGERKFHQLVMMTSDESRSNVRGSCHEQHKYCFGQCLPIPALEGFAPDFPEIPTRADIVGELLCQPHLPGADSIRKQDGNSYSSNGDHP